MIEGFLSHQDTRIRAFAAEIIARDAKARRERAEWALEEERMYEAREQPPAPTADPSATPYDDLDGWSSEDIDLPF
ncbi:MAG TPA: hypothetical protein VN253_15290 [Kofleriaceae bacterium]|nr:hypothetical protein [Kofleriaceae bacterium]